MATLGIEESGGCREVDILGRLGMQYNTILGEFATFLFLKVLIVA